jgi:hypothetical protein
VRQLVEKEPGRRRAVRDENGVTEREARDRTSAEAPAADAEREAAAAPASVGEHGIRREELRGELHRRADDERA